MNFIFQVLSIEVKHSNSTQIEEYMEDKGYKLMKRNTPVKEASVDHIYVSKRHINTVGNQSTLRRVN